MITYFIKSVLCAGLFLLMYVLLLERQKMHRFNRFYLLFSLLLSFIIPVIHITTHSENVSLTNVIDETAGVAVIPLLQQPEEMRAGTAFQAYDVFKFLYLCIVFILLLRFAKHIFFFISEVRKNTSVAYHDATLVLMPGDTEPHSFLQYIFISQTDWSHHCIEPKILAHELAHVQQKHTWDILFLECLTVFIPFHPLLFFYKKAVRLNHEFLADEAVTKSPDEVRNYQLLLLHKAAGKTTRLTNHFNFLITKKRLVMLTKTTSRTSVVCRQTAAIFFVVLTAFFLSKKSIAQDKVIRETTGQKNSENKIPGESPKLDTPRAFIWANTIGSTKEGASNELINEYKTLVNKYLETDKNGRKNINREIEPADRKRMETIVKQMNKEQQGRQEVMFVKPFPPSPKAVPTQKQFEAFKNANIYGVWVDGKKRSNDALNDYVNTDFSHYSVSKLYGAAKKGRSYTHQVNLMTKLYYQNYYDEAMSHKGESILVVVQVFPKPNQ